MITPIVGCAPSLGIEDSQAHKIMDTSDPNIKHVSRETVESQVHVIEDIIKDRTVCRSTLDTDRLNIQEDIKATRTNVFGPDIDCYTYVSEDSYVEVFVSIHTGGNTVHIDYYANMFRIPIKEDTE